MTLSRTLSTLLCRSLMMIPGILPISAHAAPEKYQDAVRLLNGMQYKVTQENGTEPAFDNAYWDNHEEGIYVDVVSGEPLFSSTDKFDSGTGWPSFTRPISDHIVKEKKEGGIVFPRTEVRSTGSNSHLGHVFDDGPKETGGARYCINSAALRFVPKAKLQAEGYGEYLKIFK